MKSKTLNDYYKEHLSGYRSWNQLSHADEYMYFKDNLGENISIDETAFSNGELYTIVTNKAGHGKHGTVIAMIKGTKADDVCGYLMKLPEGKRRMVKNVTLDMAGSMRQIAKRCFPYATQIIDRFHVQMQMQEALQELRVQYRWQAIEQENSEMQRARTERRKYIPQCFDNGDTMRQLLVRSKYLLFKSPDKWTNSQRIRAEILFKQFDDIKQLYYLTLQLGQIYSITMIKMLQEQSLHCGSTR